VDRVVYGAVDPKAGAVESLYQILNDGRLNHRPQVRRGVLNDECSLVLKEFFQRKRS
jgi:tRNA(adenine34) deaminase